MRAVGIGLPCHQVSEMRRARAIAWQINNTNDQIDEKEPQQFTSHAKGNNMSAERSTNARSGTTHDQAEVFSHTGQALACKTHDDIGLQSKRCTRCSSQNAGKQGHVKAPVGHALPPPPSQHSISLQHNTTLQVVYCVLNSSPSHARTWAHWQTDGDAPATPTGCAAPCLPAAADEARLLAAHPAPAALLGRQTCAQPRWLLQLPAWRRTGGCSPRL
jgi:hypothetical protein